MFVTIIRGVGGFSDLAGLMYMFVSALIGLATGLVAQLGWFIYLRFIKKN
jgi:hypothetical protein